MSEENTEATVTQGALVPEWVAENYRALVADENRTITFETIAESADPALAAWARQQAAGGGEDVTPVEAKPAKKPSARRGPAKK